MHYFVQGAMLEQGHDKARASFLTKHIIVRKQKNRPKDATKKHLNMFATFANVAVF